MSLGRRSPDLPEITVVGAGMRNWSDWRDGLLIKQLSVSSERSVYEYLILFSLDAFYYKG